MLVAVASVAVIIAVSALAPRAGVGAPLVLVLIGLGVSFLPAVPAWEVEPEIILAGVLPALLYAAAASFPSMDFRRDFGAISGLSVLLVVVSAVGLGFVFAWMIPGLDLAAGIALGAIVSPTDAVATSIIKRLGAPARVVTVLDGEGLLNDATSLVLLRSAVAATAASVSFWSVVGDFVWAVAVAVVSGVVVGLLGLRVRRRLPTPALSTGVSFLVPFAAYWPAEALEASGIVASVTAGLVTGTLSARYLTPQVRSAEKVNWRTVEGLLEGALFLVMGLQFFALVTDVQEEHGSLWRALGVAVVAAFGVVLVRAAFVLPLLRWLALRRRRGEQLRGTLATMQDRLDAKLSAHDPSRSMTSDEALEVLRSAWPQDTESRRRAHEEERLQRGEDQDRPRRRPGVGEDGGGERLLARIERFSRRITRRVADIDYLAAAPLGPREGVVLVWAGMRGVVTLAAAQTLPADFPQRSLLVLVAFGVAAGTLLVQGGTLPWVVRRLGLAGVEPPTAAEHAAGLRVVVHDAAADLLDGGPVRVDGSPYDPDVVATVRGAVVREESERDEDAARSAGLSAQFFELRVRVIEAQRAALLRARADGTFDSALLSRALDLLDAEQIAVEMRGESP
ncbi:sodium/proton antiporter (CPA1 family) [Isoptericola jiangsuensis]|uniref:Sodium/proton antiporter (CPA1 family) n=2 Tax=Isoptericola jiangsuensis TaxID=548579 RepID=A0A2A9F092_9MICO|nr:sodium/proton antiporter (CPA1 family) [Isoptericola jiangsuensis]